MNSDIVELQEVNLYWVKLLSNKQWLERSKDWWEGGQYASIAYNKTNTIVLAAQPGGYIAIYSSQAKRRVIKRGIDNK